MQKLVNEQQDGIQEIQIGRTDAITTPVYSPEISGKEDLEAVLDHLHVLNPNNPIVVPGFRWKKLRAGQMSGDRKEELKKLQTEFPLFMYEPPELFRYSKGGTLVTYALKGSASAKGEFNTNMKKYRVDDALSTLPVFFREFARCQLSKLYKSAVLGTVDSPDKASEIVIPREIKDAELNLSPPEVWKYRISDAELHDYFITLIKDALSFDVADICIIPPVPPLRRRDDDVVENVFDVNETMLYLCERFSSGFAAGDFQQTRNTVYPYFHLYIDSGVFAPDSNVADKLLDRLRNHLQSEFKGVALTVSGYSDIWENGLDGKFENFVSEVNRICEENYIPLMCPRSEYYGAYLSDLDVNIFSSLLRSHQEYYDQRGAPSPVDRYSRVPDIETGTFIDVLEIDSRLNDDGELSDLPGLKNKPVDYPPFEQEPLEDLVSEDDDYGTAYTTIKERFDTDKSYRKTFAKPRWLGFVELANRLQDGRRAGHIKPGRIHLSGSEHEHLS